MSINSPELAEDVFHPVDIRELVPVFSAEDRHFNHFRKCVNSLNENLNNVGKRRLLS